MVAALTVSAIPVWAVEEAGDSVNALSVKKAAADAANEEEIATAEEETAEEVTEESSSDDTSEQEPEGKSSEVEKEVTEEETVSEEETLTEEEISETTEEESVTEPQPKVRLRSRSTRSGTGTKTITVTKTWVNDDDSVRPDNLTVSIKQTKSLLLSGSSNDDPNTSPIEDKIKQIAGDGSANRNNTNIKAIKYATDAQYEAKKSSLTSSNEIQQSGEKTYMWFDPSDGTMYMYSEAGTIYLDNYSGGMFRKMTALEDISGLSHLDTSYVMDMNRMFQDSIKISDFSPISGWDVGYVQNFRFAFGSTTTSNSFVATSLEPFRNWNMSNVQNMNQMFKCWRNVTTLEPIKDWDVGKVKDLEQVFNYATSLTDDTRDYIKDWDVRAVTIFTSMFNNVGTVTKPVFTRRPGRWRSAGTYEPSGGAITPPDPDIPPDIDLTPTIYSDDGSGTGDGTNAGDCVVTKNGNTWTYVFTVPDSDGKWYVWEETTDGTHVNDKNGLVDAYTESSDGTDGLGGSENDAIRGISPGGSASLTNTNTKRKEITVTKNWDDDSDAMGVRPNDLSDVNLRLKLNGSDVKTSNDDTGRWTQSGDTWTYTFVHYSNSSVTDYSVSEDAVQFYDSDGYSAKPVTSSGGTLPDTGAVDITNEYKAYDLTVTKEVTGNQGDKTKKFGVTVSISGVVPEKSYTITVLGGTPLAPSAVTSDSSGNINQTIELKDTDSVKIEGITKGASYTVSEVYGDYDPTVTVTGDSSAATASGSASGTISADTGIKFTNNKSGILPTGLFSDSEHLMIMLGAALLGILILLIIAIRKRRADDYE